MGMFKKTDNMICKIFTEVFLMTRIPHFTIFIHIGQRDKERRQSCDHYGK